MGKRNKAQPGASVRPGGRRLSRRQAWLVVALALLVVGAGDWLVWRSVQWAEHREQALRLSVQGNFAAAEPVLRDAYTRNNRDVEVVRALALGYLSTDRDRDGELFLNRWCDLQPTEIEPHERRMEWYRMTRQDDQLMAEGQRLLELKPDHPRAQQVVAMLLVRQGRHAEAEQACRRFLQGAPGNAGIRYYLADACHGQGKDQEARTVLDSLLQKHPSHVDALVLRAILHGEAGQDDQAIVLLRRVLAQDPSHRLARSHLIQALARAGHAEEARRERDRMLREASAGQLVADLRVQPDNLDLALPAAEALLDLGRLAEGHRLLDQILMKAPGNETALRLRSAHPQSGAAGARNR